MAQNDIFRLSVVGAGASSQELINVHYYRQLTAAGDDDGVLLIDNFHALVAPAMMACISEAIVLTGYEVRNITQPEFGQDYSLPSAVAGDITGESLPPSSSAIVSWRSGLIGRRRRGRTYMWPTGESQQNAGQIGGAYQTLLTSFGNGAILFGTTNQYEKVIYSDIPGGSPDVLVSIVTGVVVPIFLASQRRRRPGTGS